MSLVKYFTKSFTSVLQKTNKLINFVKTLFSIIYKEIKRKNEKQKSFTIEKTQFKKLGKTGKM